MRGPHSTFSSKNSARSWVHMMDLMAHRTRDRLIDMAVLGGVFGGKALNAVSGRRAAVYEERHAILNKSQLSRCSITDVYLVQCNSSVGVRTKMEWFSKKTSIAGVEIPNWGVALAAVVVILLLYSYMR